MLTPPSFQNHGTADWHDGGQQHDGNLADETAEDNGNLDLERIPNSSQMNEDDEDGSTQQRLQGAASRANGGSSKASWKTAKNHFDRFVSWLKMCFEGSEEYAIYKSLQAETYSRGPSCLC